MSRGDGSNRRVLEDIEKYPSPQQLLTMLKDSEGWHYKTKRDYYRTRDRALIALTYLGALRISEALRVTKDMITREGKYIRVKGIECSKSKHKKKRDIDLPMFGEREELTKMFLDHSRLCESERLFPFGTERAWQIITATLPYTCHWLRAFGEQYLYYAWEKDTMELAKYIRVNPAAFLSYIGKGERKYPVV